MLQERRWRTRQGQCRPFPQNTARREIVALVCGEAKPPHRLACAAAWLQGGAIRGCVCAFPATPSRTSEHSSVGRRKGVKVFGCSDEGALSPYASASSASPSAASTRVHWTARSDRDWARSDPPNQTAGPPRRPAHQKAPATLRRRLRGLNGGLGGIARYSLRRRAVSRAKVRTAAPAERRCGAFGCQRIIPMKPRSA